MIKINENIRKIRVNRGYTQQIMADRLDLSLSAYSNIESGKADVNMTRIGEIAKIFDMTIVELITFNAEDGLGFTAFQFDKEGAMKNLYEHIIEQNKEYISAMKDSIAELKEKADLYKTLYEETRTKAPKTTVAQRKKRK
jgi:XRE family transcriptional regulator, regulator of sulfur utilization